MTPEDHFTVAFTMGQVVIFLDPGGEVREVRFDLEGIFPEKVSAAPLARSLERYFQGEKVPWKVRLDLTHATPFQSRVYRRVMKIPYGETATYGEIARDVQSPGGARAVGQAMAANRYPILIPCHRVLAGNGGLGGFTSGIQVKRHLLSLEGARF